MFRVLQIEEYQFVAGGFEETSFDDFNQFNTSFTFSSFDDWIDYGMNNAGSLCPGDRWWVPDSIESWWDERRSFGPDGFGPYSEYVRHSDGTWCMFDDNGELVAVYKEKNDGTPDAIVTFTNVNGQNTASISVAGTGAGGTSGNPSSGGISFNLELVARRGS